MHASDLKLQRPSGCARYYNSCAAWQLTILKWTVIIFCVENERVYFLSSAGLAQRTAMGEGAQWNSDGGTCMHTEKSKEILPTDLWGASP